MQPCLRRNGTEIKTGPKIESVGRTGNIDKPAEPGQPKMDRADTHLHFEVRYGNPGIAKAQRTTIDPLYYLPVE
ncbi:hypothetical protein [Dongia sp.]|uniref:hypothetical protein n=1 Tax=Dongia sp. TaxID=1977262 RepID=UPI0035AF037D